MVAVHAPEVDVVYTLDAFDLEEMLFELGGREAGRSFFEEDVEDGLAV